MHGETSSMPTIATTAAICIVLTAASHSVAPTVESPTRPAVSVAASLMVEVPSDEPQDVALRTRVYEEAGRIMTAMKVSQRARLDLPGIVVTLGRLPGDSAGSSYSIVIRHTPLGDTPLATIGGVCRRISDEACVQRIGADLALVLPRLHDPQPPGTPAEAPRDPPAAPATPDAARSRPLLAPRPLPVAPPANTPPRESPHARRKLNRLSKAGIGVLATGFTGLGVGIGLAANPKWVDPDDYSYLLSTHPVGYALIGTGLAMMTAGTAMLIIGLRRTPRVMPTAQMFGGRSLGFGLSGRF